MAGAHSYPASEARKSVAATAMTAVAIQPTMVEASEIRNLPITVLRLHNTISITITGTATIPFITADQTSAFTGLTLSTFPSAPNNVANAMVA